MPPPASALRVAMSNNHSGTGLHQLGAEYERKRQKLQEELQMDYKRYIDQKRDLKAVVYNKSQAYGLSLPIAERISEKEKLREERKREYNLFLQEQANTRSRSRFSVPPKPEKPTDVDIVQKHKDHSPPEDYRPAEPSTSRKDAATLKDMRSKDGRKTWDLRHQRRKAFVSRQESSDSPIEKFSSSEEQEFSHRRKPNRQIHKSKYIKDTKDRRNKRVPVNMKYDEVYIDENNNDQNWTSKAPHNQAKGAVAERPMPITTTETSARGFATGLLIGHAEEQDTLQKKKEQYKQALLSQIAEQHENKRKEKILELKVAATGATDPHRPDIFRQFGSEHHTYEKWKQKVSYKPETDGIAAKDNPELKHFPHSNVRMEHKKPPGRPTLAFSSSTWDDYRTAKNDTKHRNYSPDTSVEEYNKNLSHMIGDMTTQRVSPVLPPLPPRVHHTYKTPYDEAYNYYGSRHPLEPILSFNQNTIYNREGPQEFEGSTLPQQKRIKDQPRRSTQSVPDFGQRITVIPLRDPSSENDRQRRESYHEALKQQIKDEAERRRREREERELYDAKKVNEMMTYNPWGRAGGGAPLVDQSGNLITDLDQMHKHNEEYYRTCNMNSSFGLIGSGIPQAKRVPPLPGMEQLGYKEREHLQQQDHYKESLKRQIEENRRKQAEERERQKILEEREEKKLAEERARLLKEYEEEQQRNKNKRKMQKKTDNELWVSEGKDHDKGKSRIDERGKGRNNLESEKETRPPSRERTARTTQEQREPQLTRRGYNGLKQDQYKELLKQQVEEKRRKQAEERERQKIIEEKEEKRLAQQRECILKEYKEEEQRVGMKNKLDYKLWKNENKVGDQEDNKLQRGPSPPIPTFQNKPTNTNVPSPPSTTRQLSPKSDHLEEPSQNHPEEALGQKPHLQEDKQEVITELATLRKILRKKKKRLETKLMRADPEDEHYLSITRHQRQVTRDKGDTAVRGNRENVLYPTQKLHSTQENVQNIREFNQLKYRETTSREELLHNYPDPPTDESSLDIQQQALLRDQRRRLELMKRRDMESHNIDFWDEQEHLLSNRKQSKESGKSLPADTLFLDVYDCEEDFPRHPSAGSQQRSSRRRRHHNEQAIHEDETHHSESDALSRSSDTINKVQQSRRHKHPSEHQCGDEVDLLSGRSSCSARERPISVGTVAMEPWLQTSTSEPAHSRRPGRRTQAHL